MYILYNHIECPLRVRACCQHLDREEDTILWLLLFLLLKAVTVIIPLPNMADAQARDRWSTYLTARLGFPVELRDALFTFPRVENAELRKT